MSVCPRARVASSSRSELSRGFESHRDEVYHCPEAGTLTTDSQYVHANVEYIIYVNGYELRPEPGAAYSGEFIGYANDPWRAANCN